MALINCHECKKEISDSASSCPGCGAPIKSAQPKKGDVIPYTEQEVAVMLSKKKNTSHLLHLVLSLCTFGVWVIIWFIVAMSNSSENKGIDSQIARGKKVK
jgi:uncharacterized membrane protein YvbJ